MTLQNVSSGKLVSLPDSTQGRLRVCCAAALRHELRGQYEDAVDLLGPFWKGPGTWPRTEDFEAADAALLLLRAGSLTAWIGSKRQIEGGQELARGLLFQSANLAQDNLEIWLEAERHLATCYWRAGSFDEARVILNAALERADPRQDSGIHLSLSLAMVEWSESHYTRALDILASISDAVQQSQSELIKSTFHNGRALNRKAQGAVDAAIIEMTASCYHLEQAGHKPYLIAAEINLSNLLVSAGRVDDAHEHLERVERLARELGDNVHLAHAKDSRALAYIAEKNYHAAEIAARQSVGILEKGDEVSFLVDSLVTLGRALAGSQQSTEALKVFVTAYELAADRVGSERAGEVGLEMLSQMAGQLCLEARLPFKEVNNRFQESVYRAALDLTGGKVTEAAIRLGLSHQNFLWTLNNRFTHLRTAEKRKKSIIRVDARPPKKK